MKYALIVEGRAQGIIKQTVHGNINVIKLFQDRNALNSMRLLFIGGNNIRGKFFRKNRIRNVNVSALNTLKG
jgi:hypothetical protein